jgi:hypothetical protein
MDIGGPALVDQVHIPVRSYRTIPMVHHAIKIKMHTIYLVPTAKELL